MRSFLEMGILGFGRVCVGEFDDVGVRRVCEVWCRWLCCLWISVLVRLMFVRYFGERGVKNLQFFVLCLRLLDPESTSPARSVPALSHEQDFEELFKISHTIERMERPVLDPQLESGPLHRILQEGLPQSRSQQQYRPPPSPDTAPTDDILQDYDLAVERAQTWTGVARFGFNAMLASTEHKNKLRLKPENMERIVFFLTNPDAKSQDGGTADAQTRKAKFQAHQWTLYDGQLYRNPDQAHKTHRRHVATHEVFDILTAEHLIAGHLGRDKSIKLLADKYIGYNKDELLYVLEHCLVCSGKYIRGAVARRQEQKHVRPNNSAESLGGASSSG